MSTSLQDHLWNQSLTAAKEDKSPVTAGLYIECLNDLLDVRTLRVAALENNVPFVIILLLLFVGVSTMATTGYSAGLNGVRVVGTQALVTCSVAATLVVIIDRDRPQRGLIRVSEDRLMELHQVLIGTDPSQSK